MSTSTQQRLEAGVVGQRKMPFFRMGEEVVSGK
jgi:hypothetical protein